MQDLNLYRVPADITDLMAILLEILSQPLDAKEPLEQGWELTTLQIDNGQQMVLVVHIGASSRYLLQMNHNGRREFSTVSTSLLKKTCLKSLSP